MRIAAVILTLLVVLEGCATITSIGNTFEGAADYRIIPLKIEAPASEPLAAGPIELRNFSQFQLHPATVDAASTRFFTSGDYIRVNLRTGMIGWFSEGLEQRAINSLISSPLKGEIAIVANVTEGSRSPGSVDASGNLEGRVVFYSNDVYLDQRLNEFNVPIYGPARYGGGPLTIDIWVLELDRAESDQMSSVLQTLASLSNEIPAIPGGDILSRIGTSFLQSNADDVIGHMTVTLDQPIAGARVQDPILQVSDIVISRTADRSNGGRFLDSCRYHPSNANVTNMDSLQPCGRAAGHAGQNNIFVLGIREVPEGPSISSAVTLAELNQRISHATVGTSQTPDLSAAIEQAADLARSASAYSDSMSALSRITSGSAGGVLQLDADLILRNLQCGMLAARDRTAPVLKTVCGGERAADRQMGIAELSRLTAQLTARTCLKGDDLVLANLLPQDLTAATVADDMRVKREALYAKVRPGPPLGAACV